MSAIFLVVIFLLVFFIALNAAAGANPASLSKIIRYGGIAVAGIVGLGLVVTGNLGIAMQVFFAVLILNRLVSHFLGGRRGRFASAKSSGQSSDVRTAYFLMHLDHDSGAIEGEVLAGRFAGQSLRDLSANDRHFLREEVAADPDSLRLFDAYLERMHGADGKEEGARTSGAGFAARGPMTRERAYGVLGLRTGSTSGEIKQAHRELMIKLHPDRGGSTQLAAEVNAAKDFLLGS